MANKEKDLSYLLERNNKKQLSNSEVKELEKLVKKFGKKFNIIDIEGDFVYGYINNKKNYLGTKSEYCKYRILKHRNLKKKYSEKSEEKNAREFFIKSYKGLESDVNLDLTDNF
jgi:hypothetical protein